MKYRRRIASWQLDALARSIGSMRARKHGSRRAEEYGRKPQRILVFHREFLRLRNDGPFLCQTLMRATKTRRCIVACLSSASDPHRVSKVRKSRLFPNCGIGEGNACNGRNGSIRPIATRPDYCRFIRSAVPSVDSWVRRGVVRAVAISLPYADGVLLLNIGIPRDSVHSGVASYAALAVDLRVARGLVGVVGSHLTSFSLLPITDLASQAPGKDRSAKDKEQDGACCGSRDCHGTVPPKEADDSTRKGLRQHAARVKIG